MTDHDDTEPDWELDLESMYRCIDCDSRYHRRCEPTPDTDKETR